MTHRRAARPSALWPAPLSARERRLLLGAGLAFATFLLMAAWAETSAMVLDEAVRRGVRLTATPLLHGAMTAVSHLGAGEGLIVLIAVGSLALWRHDRCWALVLPVLMAGTGALQFAAKWAIDRPRPDLSPWGFPSGHVLSLVVFFGFVAYVTWSRTASHRRRGVTGAACAAPVLAVAYSRLYLDRHWLSDLAGGFTVGVAYLLLVIGAVEIARARRAPADAVTADAPSAP